jgi:hypothetical protein
MYLHWLVRRWDGFHWNIREARLGHLRAIVGGKLNLFECFGGLFEQGGSISLSSIDQSSKFNMPFRKAVLQVLALDPDTTYRALIYSGHLKSISHMTRGMCSR